MEQHGTSMEAVALANVWIPGIVERIVGFMHPNEAACNIRVLDKATSKLLGGPSYINIKLSQPSPPEAFAKRWAAPGAARDLPLAQRIKLVSLTAGTGSIANLTVALLAAECGTPKQAVIAAAAAGHVHVCSWLVQHGFRLCQECLSAAADAGQWDACSWLLTHGCDWTVDAVCAAAQARHADRVSWLLQQRPPLTPQVGSPQKVWAAVAEGCDLPALQRLHQQTPEGLQPLAQLDDMDIVLGRAAASRTADWQAKVQWLEELDFPRTELACNYAAACCPGDGAIRLAWLLERGYPVDGQALRNAAARGNLGALRYLLEERPRASGGSGVGIAAGSAIARAAAWNGQLEALQLLCAHGIWVVAPDVLTCAARAGHLHVVSWLVDEMGCGSLLRPFMVLRCAAESGNRELMMWLRGRRCGWNADVFAAAVRWGQSVAFLEWMAESRCPIPSDGKPYQAAAKAGDIAVLRCLRRLGCRWGRRGALFTACVTEGYDVPSLECLLDEGCSVQWAEAEQAARQRGGEYAAAVLPLLNACRSRRASIRSRLATTSTTTATTGTALE